MKIFIAAPFTKKMSKKTGIIEKNHIKLLKDIKNYLTSRGFEVIIAHERECWGKKLMTANVCTPLDFKEIKKSDIVLAFPSNPPSGGVHIELGWAAAFGKYVIIFLERGKYYSPLVHGTNKITKTKKIFFKNNSDILRKLKKVM